MMRTVPPIFAVVALLGTGQLALGGPPEDVSGRMVLCEDAELIASVKSAARRGITPQAIERFVGQKAVINTLRDGHDVILILKGIGGDRERRRESDHGADMPPVPDLSEAKRVVCWERPLDERNPRMVGIAWDEYGVAKVVFFVVYPP
jgi:hypothetical protein